MYTQTERGIQLWKPGQKDDCPVTGIHLKVKQDFEVVHHGIADIVGFINDDDWCLTLFEGKTTDLLLYQPEVVQIFTALQMM